MKNHSDITQNFTEAVDRIAPRVLTQVCRDESSPTFGSFDRNWWHYKIRDFSSIIVQQGGYFLAELAKLPAYASSQDRLNEIAVGSGAFWLKRAQAKGAFEEYYPWEQGYPPVAFSSLAVGKMVKSGLLSLEELEPGLLSAAKQLSTRFESQAGNQQVAGLAALAVIRDLLPEACSEKEFDELANRTLELQDEEGWYEEYDGPDLGYLAVTIDCLWDLYDVTGSEKFLQSAEKALSYIHRVVSWLGGSPGMLNARNTDYLVPYGLVRFAVKGQGASVAMAQELIATLYQDLDSPQHFLAAIDDRYLCHYIGHSFVRALHLLRESSEEEGQQSSAVSNPLSQDLLSCGYRLWEGAGGRGIFATHKGGCFLWSRGEQVVADYGWLVHHGSEAAVNHWWSRDWKAQDGEGNYGVSGNLFEHSSATSSPLKHIVLRVLSFLFGRHLIGFLKSKLIFKSGSGSIGFSRQLQVEGESLVVVDKFSNLPSAATIKRAPRSSKRHVSSADSYHLEDLLLCQNLILNEQREESSEGVIVTTTYSLT